MTGFNGLRGFSLDMSQSCMITDEGLRATAENSSELMRNTCNIVCLMNDASLKYIAPSRCQIVLASSPEELRVNVMKMTEIGRGNGQDLKIAHIYVDQVIDDPLLIRLLDILLGLHALIQPGAGLIFSHSDEDHLEPQGNDTALDLATRFIEFNGCVPKGHKLNVNLIFTGRCSSVLKVRECFATRSDVNQ